MKTDKKSFENFVVLLVMIAEVKRFTFNSENQTPRYRKKCVLKLLKMFIYTEETKLIFLIN